MARQDRSPEEILKEAAQAAQQLIPNAEKARDELQKKLAEAELGLVRLRAVVSAYPSITTNPLTTTTSSTTTVTSTGTLVTTQAAPPSAYIKMHMIFGKAEKPLSVKEIGDAFSAEFNEAIPQSTLYFALNKGKRKGTFLEEGGKWMLAKKKPA